MVRSCVSDTPTPRARPSRGSGCCTTSNQLDSLVALLTHIRADPLVDRRSAAAHFLAAVALVRGRPNEWAAINGEWRRTDAARGAAPPPLVDSMLAAWTDISIRGQPARGVARLDAMLARTPLILAGRRDRPYFQIAEAYAIAGRPRPVAGDSLRVRRRGQGHREAARRCAGHARALGEIALAEHRPKDALREFARADTASDGQPVTCDVCFPLAAARAYDAAGNRDSAIMMYERYERVWGRDVLSASNPGIERWSTSAWANCTTTRATSRGPWPTTGSSSRCGRTRSQSCSQP